MTENRKPRFFYGYIIVVAAFFIMAVMSGTQYSFGVFFKPLLAEFGWTRGMTAGAYSMFMILHGFLFILTGRLNDRFGPRLIMTVSGILMGLGYLLMSQISSIWHIYLVYGVIMAIGFSGGYVPLVSTIARWFVKRRGLMTGIAVAGVGAGTIVIPPAATWVISSYGWRNSYIAVGIVAMVVIVSAAQFLKRDPGHMGYSPYGGGEIKTERVDSQARGLSLSEAIHTRQFWVLVTMFLCFGFTIQAIMVHIVPHVTDLGISAIIASNILASVGALSIAGRLIMGSAGDRIRCKLSVIISLILMSISVFGLLVANETWMFYLIAIIFGFGYGGVVALQSPVVAELFGLRSHGVLVGIIACSVTFGGGIGPAFAGYIFDIMNSYQLAFLVCAVVAIMATVLTLLLRPVISEEGTND
ncbi:MFS transporter [Chloroflexota bacterium]